MGLCFSTPCGFAVAKGGPTDAFLKRALLVVATSLETLRLSDIATLGEGVALATAAQRVAFRGCGEATMSAPRAVQLEVEGLCDGRWVRHSSGLDEDAV